MATLLDTGLIRFFLPIFSFILVMVISYAILQKTNILKNQNVNIAAAFAIAVLFLFTPEAIQLIQLTTPWFIVFLIFLMLMFMTFMFLGAKDEQVNWVLTQPSVYWTIIVVILGIFLFGLVQVFGGQVQAIFGGGEVNGDQGVIVDIGRIIFHPRVLGAVFILLIASQAIRLIVPSVKKS